MPTLNSLKSTRTREKRALVKEEANAQKVLQEQHGNKLEEVMKIHLVAGKVLLNLETKFARVESANDKLVDAYDQSEDTEGAELFQQTLDEDAELMDNVVSRISELKIMKEELKRVCSQLEAQVHAVRPHNQTQ